MEQQELFITEFPVQNCEQPDYFFIFYVAFNVIQNLFLNFFQYGVFDYIEEIT